MTLTARRAAAFLIAAFLVILAIHYPVLTDPPYEDQSVGLWNEANWLADHQFNYRGLREEPHFMAGGEGARSYVVSALPAIVAALMRSLPNPKSSIVVAHLLTFATAAGVATIVHALVAARAGGAVAIAAVVFLLTLPPVAVQIEMVGMEIPLALFTLLALKSAEAGKQGWTAVWSMMAFLMKATGILVILAAIGQLALRVWQARRDTAARRQLAKGLVWKTLALVLAVGLLAWGDDSWRYRTATGWPASLQWPRCVLLAPDLWMLLFAALAVGLTKVFRRTSFDGASLLSWLVILGFLASHAGYIFIPRYLVLPAILAVVVLGRSIPHRLPWPGAVTIAAFAFAGLNVINAEGMLYPSLDWVAGADFARDPHWHARSCAYSERSLAYRSDLADSVALMKKIEDASLPAALPPPYMIYATRPRLGYVSHALDVVPVTTLEGTWLRWPRERSRDLAQLWAGRSRAILCPPRPTDETIFGSDSPSPLLLYRTRADDNGPERLLGCVDGPWPKHRRAERLLHFLGQGNPERAFSMLDTGFNPAEIHQLLTAPLAPSANQKGADTMSIESVSRENDATLKSALDAMNRNDWQTATRELSTIIAARPSDARAYYLRGVAKSRSTGPIAGANDFAAALAIDPQFIEARLAYAQALGMIPKRP